MNHLDLCSGIGGFALAAKKMGWVTTAFVERDAFCQKVLEKNFPGTLIYNDVYTFSYEKYKEDLCSKTFKQEVSQQEANGLCSIQILTGGFP